MLSLLITRTANGYVVSTNQTDEIVVSRILSVSERLDPPYAHIPEDSLFGQIKNFFEPKESPKDPESP